MAKLTKREQGIANILTYVALFGGLALLTSLRIAGGVTLLVLALAITINVAFASKENE